ncbi:sorting nexin-2-like isoform X2 [Mizuhopecten yessoensis]|uniref:Sorting nexin-2 n=1 Tax=Mizuhopecten yessoensis TaxID=6573 RepID=A0A210QRM8_MIZYE|nr:sorting nexin-2-like isoform X2 [Mizuhopecten yessoensis]OWF51369.1 Sorting nexin-2 [Mizuhopecten yessoensis]
MADGREPPPLEEEDSQKDEDDLFTEASEGRTPETEPEKVEPEVTENTRKPVKPDIDTEDLFGDDADDGDEIKLDSDGENDTNETVGKSPFLEPFEPAPASAPAQTEVVSSDEEEKPSTDTPKLTVTQTTTSTSKASSATKTTKEEVEANQYTLVIKVTEPQKMGDGMSAYMVYKVITKTSIPDFRKPELVVLRRFSDFLGLHEKLQTRYLHQGRIVPPAPEKSVLGMTKIKMSKEESGALDFVERRRLTLERFLTRTAQHPLLRKDIDFREFLERDGELPKATSTSALSSAGVKRLFHKVGDAVDKISYKMEEADEWFEEKQQQVECLDTQLRKLHSSMESVVGHRKDLSNNTAAFAKSAAMLGNAEEHTALSRALSQLADTEERIEQIQREQADHDFYVMAELLKDYIALLGAVKEVFHERVKSYKNWKDAEVTLTKKRENKAKLELANKTDKISQAKQEISEWELKVEKGKDDFEKMSAMIRKEVARFDRKRVEDFKSSIIKYLEYLMENQQRVIKCWEAFLPEAKAVA